METKTKEVDKKNDAIKTMRKIRDKIRDKISLEIMNMTLQKKGLI